tara:strand:+ start:47 stop:223 length:177 start_codon:yes stop_codon:yes gene_type:complete
MQTLFKKEWSRSVKLYKDSQSNEIAQLEYQLQNQKKSIKALIQRNIELINKLKEVPKI